MTAHNLQTRDFLFLFDLVTTQGDKESGVSCFEGIKAWHDFDGYTCWLSYKDLTVTLLFHGKLDLDYQDKSTLDDFVKKLIRLNNA